MTTTATQTTPYRQRGKASHHRIDELRDLPLEPSEYCRKWVEGDPEERGYYKQCVSALAKVTGLSRRTIEGWGSDFSGRPEYVLRHLRREDILNQIRVLVKQLDDLLE